MQTSRIQKITFKQNYSPKHLQKLLWIFNCNKNMFGMGFFPLYKYRMTILMNHFPSLSLYIQILRHSSSDCFFFSFFVAAECLVLNFLLRRNSSIQQKSITKLAFLSMFGDYFAKWQYEMQEIRNNCFRSRKCNTTLHQLKTV